MFARTYCRLPAALVLVAASSLACAADLREPLTLRSADGGVVAALQHGSGARAVLLVPGGRYTKESWDDQAARIAAAGYRVLAIELRGRGASRGGSAGEDEGMPLDVGAAVQHLRATGASSVVVVGASLGGWAAARAAADAGPGWIDGLVLLAHSPIEDPERLRVPVFFIVARGDARPEQPPRLVALREQCARAPGPTHLWVPEGTAHAQALFGTDQAAPLMDAILAFLVQYGGAHPMRADAPAERWAGCTG